MIPGLTKNATEHILNFLDVKQLTNLRSVSKPLRDLVDNSLFYNEEAPNIRPPFAALKAVNEAIRDLAKVKNLSNDLRKRKSTALGFFASLINFKSRILSKITALFCRLFPSIRREIQRQNTITAQLRQLKPLHVLQGETAFQTTIISQNTLRYQNALKKLENLRKMTMLFGGNIGYIKLPHFDLGRVNYFDEVRQAIAPEKMQNPIIRGVFCISPGFQKLNFIAIRFKNLLTEKIHCHILYVEDIYFVNASKLKLIPTQFNLDFSALDDTYLAELAKAIAAGRYGDNVIL